MSNLSASSFKDSFSSTDDVDIQPINTKSKVVYFKASNCKKEMNVGSKITNLNELKKATPHLKLPSFFTQTIKINLSMTEEVKQKLRKYCHACAGIKVPLIDIFSEKGNQMRLLQQLQHLEDIDKNNSLSTQLCMECICDIRASYKLFMQIKKAEMKLKSIYHSFDKVSSKESLINTTNKDEYGIKEIFESSDGNIIETMVTNQHLDEVDKSQGVEDNSDSEEDPVFEEFDPDDEEDNKNDNLTTKNYDQFLPNKDACKFDDLVDAKRDKIDCKNENQPSTNLKIDKTNDIISEKSLSMYPYQSSKKPNILKRKIKSMSDEDIKKSKFMNDSKLNMDLKVEIPKLNLGEPEETKSVPGDIIYVTAKGTKPNEMLLIKVKKLEKNKTTKEKKKKATEFSAINWLEDNPKNNKIDEQIEQYKKKRAEIFGEITKLQEETMEEPEVRVEDKYFPDAKKGPNYSKYLEALTKTKKYPALLLKNSPDNTLQNDKLSEEKAKLHEKILGTNNDITEEGIERLKKILGQKDEHITEFISYLKKRKIIASRLRDEDIISLYESKNNVVITRPEIPVEVSENIDPFESWENFDCDFCFATFPSKQLVFEHVKTHEIKFRFYCMECEAEFSSSKAKRMHSVTCKERLICRFCDKVLESRGKKRQHEQKHCDEIDGQLCEICGEKFKHHGTLDQHNKTKHMNLEKQFKCPQCPKKFILRPKLTFHLKTVHTSGRAYLCEDCGNNFKNSASLRHHRIRKHQSSVNLKACPVCNKVVPTYSLSKHMHTHKAYNIECAHCDKKFKNTSTLKQHLRIHEDQRQYKCHHCGVGFNRRDGLRLHLRVHIKDGNKEQKECSCQLCGQKFPNHSMLVIHRNREHKDDRNYTCHICNRSMMTIRSFEWHLAHIHNQLMPMSMENISSVDNETKRLACKHCDKTFKTEMILRAHMKNTHLPKDPIKCSDCDLKFTSEVRMKQHMMVTHGRTEGTFGCPHCPKRFVNHLRLKTHMVSHSEERPFTCDTCGFMLKTKVQLMKHNQNRHSDERPLQCKYCSHTCKQVSALVCHERTHTNERPYSCSVCHQKFKYLGDRNKHERRHEVLGGAGFKRLFVSKDTSAEMKNKLNKPIKLSEESTSETVDTLELVKGEEYINEDEIEEDSEETELVKVEDNKTIVSDSVSVIDNVYTENIPSTVNDGKIEIVEEVNDDYAEEIDTNQIGSKIITQNLMDECIMPPVTVIQIQQQDEAGNVTIIPYILDNMSKCSPDDAQVEESLILQ